MLPPLIIGFLLLLFQSLMSFSVKILQPLILPPSLLAKAFDPNIVSLTFQQTVEDPFKSSPLSPSPSFVIIFGSSVASVSTLEI